MPEESHRILLAEDDLNLGILLRTYLEGEGFFVQLCKDGEAAWLAFQDQSFDLCLFDIMMPRRDGYSLAKAIRERDADIPILFITARSMKEDKLKAYGLGADDYITKPFDEEELLWKIRALIRRLPPPKKQSAGEPLRIGLYTFDRANHCLVLDGKTKRMTEKECGILGYLSERRNRLIRREDLLKDLWGVNDYFLGRSLDVFISKIRKYLAEDPSIEIENVFKVGFIFKVKEER